MALKAGATLGVGIDALNVSRMRRFVASHKKKLSQVFSLKEIKWAHEVKSSWARFAYLFAAKEAIFKSLGLSPTLFFEWNQIEVLAQKGCVEVKLKNNLKKYFNSKKEILKTVWKKKGDYVIALAVRREKCAGF